MYSSLILCFMAFLGSQETKNAVSIANGIEKNLEKER